MGTSAGWETRAVNIPGGSTPHGIRFRSRLVCPSPSGVFPPFLHPSNDTMNVFPSTPSTRVLEPSEDEIRDYAFHLYEQGQCVPGHDLDHWFEATACLKANIPPQESHHRLHRHLNGPVQSRVFAESAVTQTFKPSPEAPSNALRGRST